MHQLGDDVGEERVERRAVLGAELGEAVVADGEVADDPAEGHVGEDEVGDAAGAADADREGVQPEGELHPRAQLAAPGAVLGGARVGQERRQVERAQDVPEQPRGVLGRKQVFRDLEAKGRLRTLRLADLRTGDSGLRHGDSTSDEFALFPRRIH